MQAKIIDFASDKLVNALHKIDKNDVKKAMTNISGKVSGKNSQGSANPGTNRVTSSEEYCAMLKNEFNLNSQSFEEDKQKSILKNKNFDTKLSMEEQTVENGM